MVRHGGLWLFSSAEAETNISDAVYRVTWHASELSERELAWIRGAYVESGSQELSQFLHILSSTSTGTSILRAWLDWVSRCRCRWNLGWGEGAANEGHFPTAISQPGVARECQLHMLVQACCDYCDGVDREWLLIADWYHLGQTVRRGVNPESLYKAMRSSPLSERADPAIGG